MDAQHNPETKAGPAVVEAAERTGLLLRELQSRVRQGDERAGFLLLELQSRLRRSSTGDAAAEEVGGVPPSEGECTNSDLDLSEIRDRVVEGVAERLLREWGWLPEGQTNALEREVVDRLIGRVLEQFTKRR